MEAILHQIRDISTDFISFIFPQTCVCCEHEVPLSEQLFCLSCLSKISQTDHFENLDNELRFRLTGRVNIERAAALHLFIKGGGIQKAIHLIKYGGRSDLAYIFGKSFGIKMLGTLNYVLPDFIIPIPIHFRRAYKRGFNQSEEFAKGISVVTGIPFESGFLRKSKSLISQTQKSRADRFEEVLSSFVLKNGKKLENKTVLLVDDVVTTGATMEAACTVLSKINGLQIQLGVIALANG